jgi:hypothetical protein
MLMVEDTGRFVGFDTVEMGLRCCHEAMLDCCEYLADEGSLLGEKVVGLA